jgi:ABC-type branched-subunit amino acid transport system substrate-binding protein
MKNIVGILLAWLCFAATATAGAEDGVSATEIKIGMANAVTGPAAGLGLQLRAGAQAAFDKVNAAGGVHGRRLRLVALDDGYDPQRAAAATRTLIETDPVFALFGYVGTPTSAAAVPIASMRGVPYLFPFTGAEFLRNPVNRLVFNLRASYFDETEAMVQLLTASHGVKNIALFIQDDAFGEAGKAGVTRAMHKRRLNVSAEVRYKRNTVDIEEGLAKLVAAKPEAVVFVGTYKPFAKLVRQARAAGLNARFLTVSFIGTSDFISEAGADGNGVIITQVMPGPADPGSALARRFNADVPKSHWNYGAMEGYADAMVLVEALRRTGPALTRAGLLSTLERFEFELGELKVAFSPTSHQGLRAVFMTEVRDGKAVPIGK